MEIHDSPNGITSVDCCPRTENYFCPFYCRGINGNYVLNIPFTIYCIIHSNSINHYKYPVCGKPPDHRAAATHLAFLDKHLSRQTEKVGSCLRILKFNN